MTYLTQGAIADSPAMRTRVSQAVAGEKLSENPDSWTFNLRRFWAAAPGWDTAWETYAANNEEHGDIGEVEVVITDSMILAQVQAMSPVVRPTV